MSEAAPNLGLQLQLLGSDRERVLVTGELFALRGDKSFAPADVTQTLLELNVPPPSNVNRELTRLASDKLVLNKGRGAWAITPSGRRDARSLVDGLSPIALERATAQGGAEFAHVEHTVIPHWAAPPRWQVGIKRLLADHPFDTNMFCMTRFPSEGPDPDPVKAAIGVARDTAAAHGLTLHLASDRLIDDDLLGNVGAYMWACKFGIGFLEDRLGNGLNYNAVIELGSMTFAGRRVALLKDKTAPERLPTDLSGQVYKPVDLDDLATVETEIRRFIETDLGIPRVA